MRHMAWVKFSFFSVLQVSVEGNIGSGKSTLLEYFRDSDTVEVSRATLITRFYSKHFLCFVNHLYTIFATVFSLPYRDSKTRKVCAIFLK